MSSGLFKGIILFIALALSLGILVLGVLSLRSYYSKASETGEPKNVKVTQITDNSVQIIWETSNATQGMVRYSSDPSVFALANSNAVLLAAENSSGTTHNLKLSLLKPNSTYYYEISIGKDSFDQSGKVSDNKHLPFSFTTSEALESNTQGQPSLDTTVFKQKFGTKDPLYDLNKDGIVNATDYLLYLSRTATPKP